MSIAGDGHHPRSAEIPTPDADEARDTRTRLVDAALERFWFQGYEVTSLSEVCKAAGANPGSLYYFFPSKEELLEAVLRRLEDELAPGLLEPAWEGVEDPVERVFALLAAYRRSLVATDLRYGCPIGSLSLEWRDPPEAVRQGLVDNFSGWRAAVRACLEEARDRFPDATDLDALATFVLTTMEGGVMLARTFRDITPFDESVASLRRHVELLTTGGSARG